MKLLLVLALFGVVAMVAAKPMLVNNVQEDFSHVQDIDDDGDEISGTYKWEDAEGNEYFVTYIADKDGYRVLDSNVVPITDGGVRADGRQGSFISLEDDDDHDDHDDDDDNDSHFDD